METLPCWDKEQEGINYKVLENDLLYLSLNKEILINKSNFKTILTGQPISRLCLEYTEHYCGLPGVCKHSDFNGLIKHIISSTKFQERKEFLHKNIEWLRKTKYWDNKLLCFNYDKMRVSIGKEIATCSEKKLFPIFRENDLFVGQTLLFKDVPKHLINFLYEEMNKAYPMTDFEGKYWLIEDHGVKEDKELLYARLRQIDCWSNLPCFAKEKHEVNLVKLEQDVLRYMVENKIYCDNNNNDLIRTIAMKESFETKLTYLAENINWLETSKHWNKETRQDIIRTIVMKESFQSKLRYLAENINWLETSKHWNKETMCLHYDGLCADIVKGLEQVAQNGRKTIAKPKWNNGCLSVGDMILFENGKSKLQIVDMYTEISKAFPFEYEFVWDWTEKLMDRKIMVEY